MLAGILFPPLAYVIFTVIITIWLQFCFPPLIKITQICHITLINILFSVNWCLPCVFLLQLLVSSEFPPGKDPSSLEGKGGILGQILLIEGWESAQKPGLRHASPVPSPGYLDLIIFIIYSEKWSFPILINCSTVF